MKFLAVAMYFALFLSAAFAMSLKTPDVLVAGFKTEGSCHGRRHSGRGGPPDGTDTAVPEATTMEST